MLCVPEAPLLEPLQASNRDAYGDHNLQVPTLLVCWSAGTISMRKRNAQCWLPYHRATWAKVYVPSSVEDKGLCTRAQFGRRQYDCQKLS